VLDMVRFWRLGIQRLYVESRTDNLRRELMLWLIDASHLEVCDCSFTSAYPLHAWTILAVMNTLTISCAAATSDRLELDTWVFQV
jgi:hypothetical protein